MSGRNRRDFLKLAGSIGASAAVARAGQSKAAAEPPPGPVRAWRTTTGQMFQPIEPPQWAPWKEASPAAIHLDPATHYQAILGFGGAFTDASCYLFHRMAREDRKALLSDLFGSEGLGFSVCRTCIGSSDYSTKMYSYDESSQPDLELKNFSIEHDRKWILPTLLEAGRINSNLFLFSSPWSPPGWMKPNGSMLGGNMDGRYMGPYAQYFINFLNAYSAAGVTIQAVTVQNEVDTDQDCRMPAAVWGQEYEIKFVKKFLAPALQKASLQTKIWILDHNYDLWGRVVDELGDPDVYNAVDGVAWHGYFGTPDSMTRVHDTFPAKHAYWTEGGPDSFDKPGYGTNWAKWSSTFTAILRNYARCIVSWNLLLDEKGKPNIGPFTAGGLVTLDSKTQKLSMSGQYRAFAHYSKTMQRGARIFASWGELPGIDHLAAENPDGSRVVVLTNRGLDQRVQCILASRALNLALPPDSVTTLVW